MKFSFFSTSLGFVAFIFCGLSASYAQAEVLLRVNGQTITSEQVIAANPAAATEPAAKQQTLEMLGRQQLLAEQVKKVSSELLVRIAAAQENVRRQILAQYAADVYLRKNPPSEAEVEQAYQNTLKHLPEKQFWVRWIVVARPDEAQRILDTLKQGQQGFTSLALSQGIDSNAQTGGALGWQSEQTLPAAVLGVVRKLQPGQVAGPIALENGYAIVQLVAERKTPRPTLEQLTPQIDQQLRSSKLEAYVQTLAKDAKIENMSQKSAASSPAPAGKQGSSNHVQH